jgi:formiminotetrahydrofolate cyclodeaminase
MRAQALQEGLEKAVEVPYTVARQVNLLWPTLVQMARICNLGTISDLQVGSHPTAF